MYGYICPTCGAHLDPQERCEECTEQKLNDQRESERIKRLLSVGKDAQYAQDIKKPLGTITTIGSHLLVEPYLSVNRENHFGSDMREPIHTVTSNNQHMLMTPTLIQYHSETAQGEVRGQTIKEPIMTVDGSNRYGLVTSFLSKFYKTCIGQDEREPLHTVTTSAGHFGEVRAFLIKYYGDATGQDIEQPLDTVTTKDRFGLVTIEGVDYQIVDIGLRMLEPRELYGCQGFPEDYIIDHDYTGKTYPRTEQVRRCGNAVCPPIPAALVRANLPEMCVAKKIRLLVYEKCNHRCGYCGCEIEYKDMQVDHAKPLRIGGEDDISNYMPQMYLRI